MTELQNISPVEVKSLLDTNAIILVDVREPQEYAAERIHGALLFPLSTFDPQAQPAPADRPLVFHCGSGKRSAMAVEQCLAAGIAHHQHMVGGIQAWKQAQLPVIAIDPSTGVVHEKR